jgi:hypothetical protein
MWTTTARFALGVAFDRFESDTEFTRPFEGQGLTVFKCSTH